jgi:hypothetical protein
MSLRTSDDGGPKPNSIISLTTNSPPVHGEEDDPIRQVLPRLIWPFVGKGESQALPEVDAGHDSFAEEARQKAMALGGTIVVGVVMPVRPFR